MTVSNPAQRRVLSELRGVGVERPTFDPALAMALRERIETSLEDLAGELDRPLWASKQALSRILGCEAHHVSEERSGFAWSLPAARGSVVHKAIQLSVTWKGEPAALDLVDAGIERLLDDAQSGDLGAFLGARSSGELAELRSDAGDLVCKFLEQWPPLLPSWKPRSESRLRVELCGGRIILSGKADLTLGTAMADTAGRLIVDFKTGRPGPHHTDDLRFYALLDTLVIGIPPFRLAGYYLDEASFHPENVTEQVLEAAARRTIAGVTRLIELQLGLRSPQITPNPACGWCALRPTCAGAEEWDLARRHDSADGGT
ncbi:MAG: PD-(D/E)XK nuclease family protein [Actinobacteria bacterium]|nr:PD-(D/E)XK nuclease family protein [Actinomycetota bacterium]